ncbi:alpha/beta fold hydrolase [Planktotalea sp.]|uniref:alpha/beta hydrolase family protein n=1 Tax=Planktotalea sp. TaxID=2029877 RepID=UPI0025FAAC8E|nr:alpha/beta fold hydrolase [Planktotalea sp.]
MKRLMHILSLGLLIAAGQAHADNHVMGWQTFKVSDAQKDRPVKGLIWYPAHDDARVKRIQSNGVWVGVDAAKKATPLRGKHPLVVLSHGMYGNERNQNWLAAALVSKGYIVASLSHPGTSTWLRDPDDARRLWERPRDVSRVITHLLNDTRFAPLIDPERIFMGGHSLGGWTAVWLAGGRYDGAKVQADCAADPTDLICEISDMWNIAKTPQDVQAMEQDLSDPRIKAIAVFDLGGTQTFNTATIAAIKIPLLVFGAPKQSMGSLDLNRESRALVAALPKETTRYIEPASLTHFDFLGVCTDRGMEILEDEVAGDGELCEGGTRARIADHALITNAVLEFFANH